MAGSSGVPAGGLRHFLTDMREGWRRMVNVIFALIFRDIKTRSGGGAEGYGMHGLIGIIVEPAIGVAAISASGTSCAGLKWAGACRAVHDRQHDGLFPRPPLARICSEDCARLAVILRLPNVKPFDAVMARFILELVLTFIGGVLLCSCSGGSDLTIQTDRADGLDEDLLAAGPVSASASALTVGVYGTRFPIIPQGHRSREPRPALHQRRDAPGCGLDARSGIHHRLEPDRPRHRIAASLPAGSPAFPAASEAFLFVCTMAPCFWAYLTP